jgi:O-antigen/teichoic acid export membrane protein
MPLLVHVDRFLIGGLLTVGAVAYYATPSEIVVKILIFPRAWVSVLFPTFAAHFAHRQQQTADLLARSLSWLLGLLFPVILLLLAGAPDGLRLWLGAEFAVRSTPVMRWLGTGIFLYSLTWIPFSFLQGIGRPDIPARIHLLEFPLYVGLSVMLIRRLGITGAAAAWALRAAIELAVMLFCARRYAPVLRACAGRWLLMGGLAAALGLGAALCGPLRLRAAVTATGLAVWAAAAWRGLLPAEDRAALQRWWANRQNRS